MRPLTTFARFDSGNRFTRDLWTLFLEPSVSGMSGSTADTCTCLSIGPLIIWRMTFGCFRFSVQCGVRQWIHVHALLSCLVLGRTEQRVFRSTNKTLVDGPCQGTGGRFGFQDAATEVAAPINCRSTPYTYCCEFGVPRDCSPGTAAGHCSQTSYAFCCGVGTLPTYGVPTMDTSIRMCWTRQKCLQRRC